MRKSESEIHISSPKFHIQFRIPPMPSTLDPQLKRALAERIRYYNELGIYDFYRRDSPEHLFKFS